MRSTVSAAPGIYEAQSVSLYTCPPKTLVRYSAALRHTDHFVFRLNTKQPILLRRCPGSIACSLSSWRGESLMTTVGGGSRPPPRLSRKCAASGGAPSTSRRGLQLPQCASTAPTVGWLFLRFFCKDNPVLISSNFPQVLRCHVLLLGKAA